MKCKQIILASMVGKDFKKAAAERHGASLMMSQDYKK
jgi:hypothetical protein